ncbi:MAG: hypothetical protein KGM92_20765 [Acidobacteriota bacterium]|nr:hypothetical protein [Acidobacteriota bacterium]
MATSRISIRCIEKERLMQEFLAAISDHHRMQSAQVAALRKGDGFLFEKELAEASERRLNVKYAIIAHKEKHGC